jgi:amino acid transporter
MSNNALAVQLPRVLGARDVALLYTIAIVSLQWLSTAAQMGPASLLLWLLALVVFFVPSGLAVMELSSRYDGEGGLYLWVKHSFGHQEARDRAAGQHCHIRCTPARMKAAERGG